MATAGRPSCSKIELNLNDHEDFLDKIKHLCNFPSTKRKIKTLCSQLNELLQSTHDEATQTDRVTEDSILDEVLNLSDDEMLYIFRNIWINVPNKMKLNFTFDFYLTLNSEEQCQFFSLLGDILNESVYETSKIQQEKVKGTTFQKLSNISKESFLETCDKKLLAFLNSLTYKKGRQTKKNDNTNEIGNIVDNILKARNSKYISETSVREAIITYISSSKSVDTNKVISKQGGKGTRPVLDTVIQNTYQENRFTAPPKISTFYSFDNIQTLLGTQRITGKDQERVIAVVVTSVMCTLPDGMKTDTIQYKPSFSPSHWYSEYQIHEKNKVPIDKLDNVSLLECATVKKEDEQLVFQYFDKDLEAALKIVEGELNPESLKDEIDDLVKEKIRKTRRLCMNNHIVENIRNRKYCDRSNCKQPLKEHIENDLSSTIYHRNDKSTKTASEKRADHYMNVENINTEYKSMELAAGALEVNPNTSERIVKVLKDIMTKADINKPCVRVTLTDTTIEKELIGEGDSRSWVAITADGLPYKQMIKIIREYHNCDTCKKEFKYITELRQHFKSTGHTKFYQTFGNILIQSGHFHYCQTLLRCYVKLTWDLDLEEGSAAIGLDSMKAKFMVSKVTNFRKVFDVVRSMRQSRMREFVLPYIRWAKINNFPVSLKDFYVWKDVHVKSKTYDAVFDIERYFGTSILLYISAMRSNNNKVLLSAKRVFSPLLHLTGHHNYSVIDIHSDYQDTKLEMLAKPVSDYMEKRKFTNKKNIPYCYSPHDERHEEYNKRGLNFQPNIKSVEDFKESFSVCDDYQVMKDACFSSDYQLKNQNDMIPVTPDYEANILAMRVKMRSQKYLHDPSKASDLLALNQNKMDESLCNIIEMAKIQKKENVFSIIKNNDFFCGFKKTAFDIFGSNSSKIDYNEQIRIFIGSLENSDQKFNLYEYWQNSKQQSDYCAETFIDDLIEKKYDFV